MYFFRFHANDDQFNEKLVLPTTLSDQGDSDKKTSDFAQTTHPFSIKQEKENQKQKGRRKILDQMTSKNQMRRVIDFKCPSLEFRSVG
jgi:hypothetical protein